MCLPRQPGATPTGYNSLVAVTPGAADHVVTQVLSTSDHASPSRSRAVPPTACSPGVGAPICCTPLWLRPAATVHGLAPFWCEHTLQHLIGVAHAPSVTSSTHRARLSAAYPASSAAWNCCTVCCTSCRFSAAPFRPGFSTLRLSPPRRESRPQFQLGAPRPPLQCAA